MDKYEGAFNTLLKSDDNDSNQYEGAFDSIIEKDGTTVNEYENAFNNVIQEKETAEVDKTSIDKLSPEYKEFLDNRRAMEVYQANKDKIDALVEKTYQNELRVKYVNQFPQYFTDGKLTDLAGAKSAGIVYESTIDVGGTPNAGVIKFADEEMLNEREQLVPRDAEDATFLSEVKSVNTQMDEMLTIQDRDKIGERYTYRKPPRNVKVDYETYLLSDTFKEKMKDSPYMEFYYNTFGENGAKTLAYITAGAQYVRGGTADLYKTVHEAIDDGTDGNFTKLLGMNSRSGAKKFTGDLGQILEVAEVGAMMRILTRVPKAKELANDILNAELKKKKKLIKTAGKVKKIENRRLNINKAKNNELIIAAEKAKKASELAKENKAIKEELIIDYEVQIGARDKNDVTKILDENKLISTTLDKNGKQTGSLRVDYDKARIVGQRIAKQEYDRTSAVDIDGDVIPKGDFDEVLNVKPDDLLGPILLPDKIDPLIAIASELRKNNPNLFQGKMTIDGLLNATIKGDFIASDELLGLLNKYDLTLEEYITMTVGSASQAGKVLQKVAMLKGKKLGKASRTELIDSTKTNKQGFWKKAFQRTVDVGRGALVSMFATMVRNVESTLIRAPLETLSNIPNTLLYNITEEGLRKRNFKYLVTPNNWRGQLRNTAYLFDNLDVKDYVDYILKDPQFKDKFDVLFTQISEIKKLKGPDRSTLPIVQRYADTLISGGEDLVDTLNTFNRWQDHLTRSAYFLSSLETLVKRNYNGLDLIKELNKGRIKEFLNDSPTIMLEDSRKFADLVAEATETARNATYSNMPNFSPFRELTRMITNTGLTAVFAFPRFVFTSMELLAQYAAGGIALVPIRRAMRLVGDKPRSAFSRLSERDLEDISRNLIGLSIYQAANIYRMKEKDRPESFQGYIGDPHPNYKFIRTGDGEAIDITPQFPLRQALFMVDFYNRLNDGTLNGSIVGDFKEMSETFLGATLRSGRTTSIVEDFIQSVGGGDEEAFNRIVKGTATLTGTFAQRYGVPLGQIVDLERGLPKLPYINIMKNGELIEYGLMDNPRVDTMKDSSEEYKYGDLGGSFKQQVKRPFIRRFGGDTDQYPDRSYVLDKDGKKRLRPLLKVFGGLSFYEENPPDSLFLEEYGFTEWKTGSKETSPQVRGFENKLMGSLIPTISKVAQAFEKSLIEKNRLAKTNLPFRMNPDAPPKYSKKYIQSTVRGVVSSSLTELRSMFKESAYAKLLDKGLDNEKGMAELINGFLKQTNLKKFKRLPKDIRNQAKQIFEEQNKRVASYENGKDILELFTIGNFYRGAQNILK
tara:strand:- start:1274 stop:5200 length:3927 start_codon:yes stop_codon:yes gene_type:complete